MRGNQSKINMSAIVEDVKLFCQVCTEFWSNSSGCTGRLCTNMTKHTSEAELYVTLATLENFECWNQTLLIKKCHHFK